MIEEKIKEWWEKNIKNFTPDEFDDPTEKGSGYKMNIESVLLLDKLRDEIKRPLFITRGFSTKEHNEKVCGAKNSAHLRGFAYDIECEENDLRWEIVRGAYKVGYKRIGVYGRHVHLDTDLSLPQRVLFLPSDIGK